MRLISIHPAVLLVNYKSCRRHTVPGASVFAPFSRRSSRPAVARQTQRALLTLCLGRFDTGVEIGHALAQAFGIAGEYSFAPEPISDPEPSRENANFAQCAFTKGYQGAEEFTGESLCSEMILTLGTCRLRSDSLRRSADISDLTLLMMTNVIRISIALKKMSRAEKKREILKCFDFCNYFYWKVQLFS